MPKRSRYNHVTFADGKIQIYAHGINYMFDTIKGWEMCESASTLNPEDIDYMIHVVSPLGDCLITCMDETELLSIADELVDHGL